MAPNPLIAPALISAGSSLLGGLFGRKKEQTTRTNFVQLRDDALAAGFNPLTALRATGGGGNTTTTLPGLSAFEVLADAVGAGVDTYLRLDPIGQKTRDLQNELLQREIETLKAARYAGDSSIGRVPSVQSTRSPVGAQTALGNVLRDQDGNIVTDFTNRQLYAADGTPLEAETQLWSEAQQQGGVWATAKRVWDRNVADYTAGTPLGLLGSFVASQNPYRGILTPLPVKPTEAEIRARKEELRRRDQDAYLSWQGRRNWLVQ